MVWVVEKILEETLAQIESASSKTLRIHQLPSCTLTEVAL